MACRVLALGAALAAFVGCSSSSSPAPASSSGTTTTNAAFAKFCTGTLTHSTELEVAQPGGGYFGDGSQQVSAGTSFLLSDEIQTWQGYVIASDGTPSLLAADFSKGLVEGTDFTSDCAPTLTFTTSTHAVLLRDTTLYPDQALTGTPCTLAAGTELTQLEFFGATPNSVSSKEISAKCGVSTAYAPSFLFGELVDR
jgi:hypothetical protein